MSPRIVAAGLAALALAVLPQGAAAGKNYSMNSVNGEYEMSPTVHTPSHLDYSMNSANGEYDAPPVSQSTVAAVETATGFSWSAALAGAGATLVLVLAFSGARRLRRRDATPIVRTSRPDALRTP